MDPIQTGRLISDLRKQKGMNQIEFAQQLNISNRTVSKWENGDGFPDITLLPDIAELLGITTDELLSGELNKTEDKKAGFPTFVFKGKLTYKSYLFLYHEVMRKRVPIWFKTILFIFYLLMIVVEFEEIGIHFLPATVVLCSLILFIFAFPYVYAWAAMQNAKQLGGKNANLETKLEISDKVYLTTSNSTQIFSLDELTGFYIKKNSYIFRCNKKVYFLMDKEGLSDADNADFEAYMRSNVVNVKDPVWIKVFQIIASVLLIMAMMVVISIHMYSYKTESKSSDISISEIVKLDDSQIYDQVSSKLYDKVPYEEESDTFNLNALNRNELAFYYVDEFINEYYCGGIHQYLAEYPENASYLYDAFSRTGLTEQAKLYQSFIDENNMNVYDIKSIKGSLKSIKQEKIDAFDEAMMKITENDEIETALAEFVKQNQADFE